MSITAFYLQVGLVLGGLSACLLAAQWWVNRALVRRHEQKQNDTLTNVAQRLRTWWAILVAISLCVPTGRWGVAALFFLVSLQCCKEFFSVLPTSASDHGWLVYCFYLLLPLTYLCLVLELNAGAQTAIICLAALFLFTTNTSRLAHWRYVGVLICIVALAFLPKLVWSTNKFAHTQNMLMLGFVLLVVQVSDIAQFVFGKLWGRHKLAPRVSPNKTWEGLFGGCLFATVLGAAMVWMTPFSPFQAAGVAFALTVLGAIGALGLSAIKRQFGVKDWGGILSGHGGMLDRVDSLVLPAPALYAYLQWVTIASA
jgi:phosphatidate cytidylyltransferase